METRIPILTRGTSGNLTGDLAQYKEQTRERNGQELQWIVLGTLAGQLGSEYGQRDLNPHGINHQGLNLACLPIPTQPCFQRGVTCLPLGPGGGPGLGRTRTDIFQRDKLIFYLLNYKPRRTIQELNREGYLTKKATQPVWELRNYFKQGRFTVQPDISLKHVGHMSSDDILKLSNFSLRYPIMYCSLAALCVFRADSILKFLRRS